MQVKIEENSASGWLNGFLGMVIFSGSLPATRVAVLSFDPLFLTVARASIAGLFALLLLWLFKQQRPRGDQLFSLGIVAFGVVVGFPLLTALALQHVTSAHSIVFLGLLPVATAIFGVLRGGERPRPAFWLDWFYLLVPGPGPGRYCQRRPTAIAAALFWPGAGSRLTA
jgi:drug/metabolite transporter (DMT)-like permease